MDYAVAITSEFVWNMATFDLREAVNITSEEFTPSIDEFARARHTKAPSRVVRPPAQLSHRFTSNAGIYRLCDSLGTVLLGRRTSCLVGCLPSILRTMLKDLGEGCGEVKSMRTHPNFLRQGVAAQLLEHIIGAARDKGMRRLSLETGTGPAFEPALALYRRCGFINGPAFADYPSNSSFNSSCTLI